MLLRFLLSTQFLIPFGFQGICDEAIVRVDLYETASGEFGFVASSFDVLPMHRFDFLDATLDFMLDRECDFDRCGCESFEEQHANRIVDGLSRDGLTDSTMSLDPIALAYVSGKGLPTALLIADGHSIPAYSAHHHALKERRPFSDRALATVFAIPLCILSQALLVAFETLPRKVARVRVYEHGVPLVARQLVVGDTSVGAATLPMPPVDEGASVPWIVEHLKHSVVTKCAPDELALL